MLISRQLLPIVATVTVLLVGVSLIGSARPGPTILFVDDDAPLGGDGLSWDTAYRFLQDALANAAGATEIRVAQGTYKPDQDEGGNVTPGDREATFQLVNGVSVLGGYAGIDAADPDERDVELHETRLSGDLLGNDGPDFANNDENVYHVVNGSAVSRSAVLEGFTITAGNGNGPFPDYGGGGILSIAGSPTIATCIFVGNSASNSGGGMENRTGSNPLLLNCVFSANQAGIGGATNDFNGSNSTFVNCTFTGNTARVYGGAISNSDANVTLINCMFSDNTANQHGSAIHMQSFTTGLIVNCTIVGNHSSASTGASIYLRNDSNTAVSNSILWENSNGLGMGEPAQIANLEGGTLLVHHCCVQGWTGSLGGVGNFGDNPLFVDDATEDFHLSAGSPCIDAGDNTAVPVGITTDLDGNPRFVDDPDTPDTGNGELPVVDMGAYEFQALPPCPWDLSGDGNVFVVDLLLLLGDFGSCDGSPADFDGDGCVTVSDLLTLIFNFGPCPDGGCPWDVNGDGTVDRSDLRQVLGNLGPCDGCPEDVDGDGVVDFEDVIAVAVHFGPCP